MFKESLYTAFPVQDVMSQEERVETLQLLVDRQQAETAHLQHVAKIARVRFCWTEMVACTGRASLHPLDTNVLQRERDEANQDRSVMMWQLAEARAKASKLKSELEERVRLSCRSGMS